MQNCNLETEDDITSFTAYYRQFVEFMEKNPLSGTDEKGKEAAILAGNFYHLFYPNDAGVYLPVEIYLRTGSTGTPEKAADLYQKMHESLNGWRKQSETARHKLREEFLTKEEEISKTYGKLLQKRPSSFGFFVKWLLMLALLGGAAFLMKPVLTGPKIELELTARNVGLILCALITVGFAWKSILWLVREKTRIRLLKTWQASKESTAGYGKENARSFRSPEAMEDLLKNVILANKQSDGIDAEDSYLVEKREAVDYGEFLQKKSIHACNTIRPIHLVTMGFVCICLVFCETPDTLLEARSNLEAYVKEELETSGLREKLLVRTLSDSMYEISDDVQLHLTVRVDGEGLHDSMTEDAWMTLSQGDALIPEDGMFSEETGRFWYEVITSDDQEGYIPADACLLKDDLEAVPSSFTVTDSSGAEANRGDLSLMQDGYVGTYCRVEVGDTLNLDYADTYEFCYLYIVNGDMNATSDSDLHAVTRMKITFDDTKEYNITLPNDSEIMGRFVRIPNVDASKVKIQILESGDGTAPEITELKLCGNRME
jgi:hypothetical protein